MICPPVVRNNPAHLRKITGPVHPEIVQHRCWGPRHGTGLERLTCAFTTKAAGFAYVVDRVRRSPPRKKAPTVVPPTDVMYIEHCLLYTSRAGAMTAAAMVRDAASYSSSLPKARRQPSTASVRRTTAPTGMVPLQDSSSMRRETCMGRRTTAGPTTAATRALGAAPYSS